MLNTSFQPMLSHLFSNLTVQERLNQCKMTTIDLTTCLTEIINQQFQNLNQQHIAKNASNSITIIESNTDIEMPETYHISLFAYPEEIAGIETSTKQHHDLLLFFTHKKNEPSLNTYLDSLDDYGAPLKVHSLNIDGQQSTIQILERYYDFDTSTFNDFR